MAVILLKFSSFDFFKIKESPKIDSFHLSLRRSRIDQKRRTEISQINQQTSSENSQFISSLILFPLLKYSGRGVVRENSPKKHPPWATFPENELPLCKPTSFSTSSIHRWIIDSSEAVFSVARLDAPPPVRRLLRCSIRPGWGPADSDRLLLKIFEHLP